MDRFSLIQEIGYRIFRGPGLKKRFIDTTKIVGECKDAKILDVGCGPGIYAQYFAKKVNFHNSEPIWTVEFTPLEKVL